MKLTALPPAIITTIVTVAICVLAIGGGHGTYVPAIFIFPFSMTIGILEGHINTIASLIALIQFPVYFLIISNIKGDFAKSLAIVALFMIHCSVAIWAMENRGNMF